ncbi:MULTISPECIES: hypothetical protein [Haloferacaceae]|uniref:Uncharacterized protein n=1 Tax=Halorubrum trueperi TaxID=2004704 RepID=A0ABD5UM14_9EURY|nr:MULTISPECIES: hypothetical protein [Haloferacales]
MGDNLVGGAVVTNGAAVFTVSDSVSSRVDGSSRGSEVTRVETTASSDGSIDPGRPVFQSSWAERYCWRLVARDGGWRLDRRPDGVVSVLIGCPWVLEFATPFSVATSIEETVIRGIIVFDEIVFECLRNGDVVVGESQLGRDDTLTQLSNRDTKIIVLIGDDEDATGFLDIYLPSTTCLKEFRLR